jgi:cation:H+ antiporter
MLELLLWVAGLPLGFVVLNQGAKFLTDNAAVVAKRNGLGRFAVGAVLVSVLASLPEILVSSTAMLEGSPDIALGNALASSLVAISLVIGLSAMIRPIKSTRAIVLRDAVFLATFSVVAAALLLDGDLTATEGLALVALFVPYVINLLLAEKSARPDELKAAMEHVRIRLELAGWIFGRKIEIRAGLKWLVFGVVWAVLGAQLIVRSALGISGALGLSEWIVGITAVGIGTSLPDIAPAIHAVRRGYTDLALGAGIGASIATILLDIGVIGLLRPAAFRVGLLLPMVAGMVGGTFLLLFLMVGRWRVTRAGGALLFAVYFVAVAVTLFVSSME